MVEIAWGVYSRDAELVRAGHYFIKQNEPIPQEAIRIHGITTEKANAEGRDIVDVLKEFQEDVDGCARVVCHNIAFDKPIWETEYIRTNLPKPFKGMTSYDTMRLGQDVMRQRKPPTLKELSEFLDIKVEDEELHGAEYDTYLTAMCFFTIKMSGQHFYLKH